MFLYYNPKKCYNKTLFFLLQLDTADNLPKQICSNCITNLHNAYTFLNNCTLINKILIECSAHFESNIRSNIICRPNDKNCLVNPQELVNCETKEEPAVILDSDNCNTEITTDLEIPSLKAESLHTAVDIKEESQVAESIADNVFQNDFEYLKVQMDYGEKAGSNDWNMENYGKLSIKKISRTVRSQ